MRGFRRSASPSPACRVLKSTVDRIRLAGPVGLLLEVHFEEPGGPAAQGLRALHAEVQARPPRERAEHVPAAVVTAAGDCRVREQGRVDGLTDGRVAVLDVQAQRAAQPDLEILARVDIARDFLSQVRRGPVVGLLGPGLQIQDLGQARGALDHTFLVSPQL